MRFYSILSAIAICPHAIYGLNRRAASRFAVTPHILELTTSPFSSRPLSPSSSYLNKRNGSIASAEGIKVSSEGDLAPSQLGKLQQQLLTLGGRVYMTNITLANQPYTLVVDTGSSDTWLATTTFKCLSPETRRRLPQTACNFGTFYDRADSKSFAPISTHDFSVSYTDGEFLIGDLGSDLLSIGGLEIRQTIGLVEKGWWIGDGLSSGLLGLAYPTLASGAHDLNYTSIIFSLFNDGLTAPVFSLAISRLQSRTPRNGGVLAIGGIPDVEHSGDWVSVPIVPLQTDSYAFYSIPVDGFLILPPTRRRHRAVPPPRRQMNFEVAPIETIIDSGTTLIYLPAKIADYIASVFVPPARLIAESGLYVVDCEATAPRVGVIIGGNTYFINEIDLVSADGKGAKGALCVLAVQRQSSKEAVLGDSFLKNVVAVFDVKDNIMSFASREKY